MTTDSGRDTGHRPPTWYLGAGAAAALVGLVGTVLATDATGSTAALWLVTGVAMPLLLAARRPRISPFAMRVVVVTAVALPIVWTAIGVLAPPDGATGHDGGVIVTRAAAATLLDGENPYATDFTDALPDDWQMISMDGTAAAAIENPIRRVFPYLPGVFLLMAPLELVSDAGDAIGDPRWLMLATHAAAVIALATWPGTAAWTRVAAVVAASSPMAIIHLADGTNDLWSVALVILAARCVPRRPLLAGLFAALAVSVKFLLFPALVVWAAWTWHARGWSEVRRYWIAPATLLVTVVPFLIWSLEDLLNDTILFWMGRSDVVFPLSGIGLPALFPGVVHGPVLVVATVTSTAIGVAGGWWVLRRFPVASAIPVAAAVVVLGVLVPARTFQGNYVVVVTGLLCAAPLLASTDRHARAAVDDQPARSPA